MNRHATVHIITGPTCSGKTAHVTEHAKPGDIVIDLDAIANALTPGNPTTHDYPAHILRVASAARTTAIDKATRTPGATVWIIHANPTEADLARYHRIGYTITTLDPGRDVVEARVKAERPPGWMAHVTAWYERHAPTADPAAESHRPSTLTTSPEWT